ncbi:transporter [Pseudomonas hefeiensis]|uniref:SphA family protein n=1 Tax=Pseudomonas hefeiensis TaxID=2738125 RepID=UPI0027363AE3|nr:transporter [Pseudomonas sp. FP53]WLH97865.1 transporter [Pseudomonas sp. FP53]
MKRFISLIVVLFLFVARITVSQASEGVAYGGPLGGTDMGSAYLPPQPGFYGGVIYARLSGSKLNDKSGKEIRGSNVKYSGDLAGVGLLYVYPFQLGGGAIASGLIQPLTLSGNLKVFGQEQSYSGMGDLYADLFSWSKHIGGAGIGPAGAPLPYGLTVKASASIIFPTGEYNEHNAISPGANKYFFLPNVAFTYLTSPNMLGEGFEMSTTLWYQSALRNRATDIQSGDVVNVDFSLTQRSGLWQYGLAGQYAKQIEDDTFHGESLEPDGNRMQLASVGPIVSRMFPEVGLMVKAKGSVNVKAVNGMSINSLTLSLVKKF